MSARVLQQTIQISDRPEYKKMHRFCGDFMAIRIFDSDAQFYALFTNS
jgi:hypothetical protein